MNNRRGGRPRVKQRRRFGTAQLWRRMPDRQFWSGRRVFLTGHTGFKGSWLCLWLQELGAKVTGYALPPSTQPNMFELCSVAEGMNSVFGDIRDLLHLQRTMKEAEPEVVFHLAAQPLVRASYK